MLDALLLTKTSPLLSALYPECLWKIKTKEKILYLTFDDGPIPEVTPFILDELKKHNARATFFCIGKNIAANPAIFKRILKEGHNIGNHTYDHLNGWTNDNRTYYRNVQKGGMAIEKFRIQNSEFTHLPDKQEFELTPPSALRNSKLLFRPPYGKLRL